jgi:hypothetical protein
MRKILKYLAIFFTIAIGCKEKYILPDLGKNKNLLIVDGTIENGGIL